MLTGYTGVSRVVNFCVTGNQVSVETYLRNVNREQWKNNRAITILIDNPLTFDIRHRYIYIYSYPSHEGEDKHDYLLA